METAAISLDRLPPPPLFNDERRECPRLPLEQIELCFDGRRFSGFGDVSTGGALWLGEASAVPPKVELRFALAGEPLTFRLRAEVISARPEGHELALHLRFVDLPFEAERRIARHVDECLLLSGQR